MSVIGMLRRLVWSVRDEFDLWPSEVAWARRCARNVEYYIRLSEWEEVYGDQGYWAYTYRQWAERSAVEGMKHVQRVA